MLPKHWKVYTSEHATIVQFASAGWPGATICFCFAAVFLYKFNTFWLPSVLMLLLAVSCAFYRKQWHLKHNFWQIRRTFCGLNFTTNYTDGKLEASKVGSHTESSSVKWLLVLTTDAGGQVLHSFEVKEESDDWPPEVMSLYVWLSQITGWPLTVKVP